MNSIFKESAIETIKKIRKGFLWAAVCLLISGFVLGAMIILVGQNIDYTTGMVIAKILGTMAIFTLLLFVGVNNCIRMEKGNKLIQILALVGLAAGFIGAVMGTLMVWEVVPSVEVSQVNYECYEYYDRNYIQAPSCNYEVFVSSMFAKITSVFVSLAAAGFWLSNVLSIKETIKVVKPLKITSAVCEVYCSLFSIVTVFLMDIPSNLVVLSGFMGFAFVVTALVAWIISRTSGKKNVEASVAAGKTVPKTDEEIRAEVEEKVRREMIEKEVREKMEAERLEKAEKTDEAEADNSDSEPGMSLGSDGQF